MDEVPSVDFLIQKESIVFSELHAMFTNAIEALSPVRVSDAYCGKAESCLIMGLINVEETNRHGNNLAKANSGGGTAIMV